MQSYPCFQYRPDFPSFLKEHAVFVDIAPRLQLLAEDILQQHIQVTISNLKEVWVAFILIQVVLIYFVSAVWTLTTT